MGDSCVRIPVACVVCTTGDRTRILEVVTSFSKIIEMIYELAHWLKSKCVFIWNALEWGNSVIFSLKYRKGLKKLNQLVNVDIPRPYILRVAVTEDVGKLVAFFNQQPKESFRFFNPHGFDERSVRKVIGRTSFLTFILIEQNENGEEIVGYAFMRSFTNGSAYRGYMIDVAHRGRGLAKIIGYGLNSVGDALHLEMFKSISPQNPASLKVTQAVCDIEILRTLDNGDYLIKCISKPIMKKNKKLIGGVN